MAYAGWSTDGLTDIPLTKATIRRPVRKSQGCVDPHSIIVLVKPEIPEKYTGDPIIIRSQFLIFSKILLASSGIFCPANGGTLTVAKLIVSKSVKFSFTKRAVLPFVCADPLINNVFTSLPAFNQHHNNPDTRTFISKKLAESLT